MSDVTTRAGSPREYVLGHSEDEIDRLKKQAALIDPLTRRFFADAGIAPGMRVLDVGSGVGDVAFLAAELVGSTGEVVGTDRSAAALEIARQRAIERSLSNVRFLDGDPAELSFDRPFDAVRGRYVLQFQADPGAMLGKLAAHVKPGGVVVFHEIDWGGLDDIRRQIAATRWPDRETVADPSQGLGHRGQSVSAFFRAGPGAGRAHVRLDRRRRNAGLRSRRGDRRVKRPLHVFLLVLLAGSAAAQERTLPLAALRSGIVRR